MSTNSQIIVNGITVEVVYKDIKNLHLGVYPPNGHVRVATPPTVSLDAVRLAVIGKLGWIKRKQTQFEDQPRQSKRQIVNGESHYYLGRRYRLSVNEQNTPAQVVLRNKSFIDLYIRPGSTVEEREAVLQDWYRKQLKVVIAPLMEKWQKILGVYVPEWRIKKMKTKWGSCNIEVRRIWFNLELAKKSEHCIEYIVVHELIHLEERHHNERFTELLTQYLPNWRTLRDELNNSPLGYEAWY